MKPRAGPSTFDSAGDDDHISFTEASMKAILPTRATTQQERPMKTPDRVDFRARTYPAPLVAERPDRTDIPDLADLREGLEESSQTKLNAFGKQAGSPSTFASKSVSKRSESSLEDDGQAEQGRRAPPAKKTVVKQPKARTGKAKAPPRRSTRLQRKENVV